MHLNGERPSDGVYSWAGSRIEEVYSAYAMIDAGSIDVIGTEADSWNVTQAGARYERLLNYQTDIDASFGDCTCIRCI